MDVVTTSQVLGNVGEFVGAIAVVVTLAYLAVQVRHSREATESNTRSLRAAARFEAGKCWWQEALQLSLSPDMARILALGFDDVERLTDGEVQRFYAWGVQYSLRDDMLYHQYREGVLPQDVWKAHEQVIASTIEDEKMWRLVQGHVALSDEFRHYLEALKLERRPSSWSWPPQSPEGVEQPIAG